MPPTRWCRYSASSARPRRLDRKSTRLNSSHMSISYAVFCLKKNCRARGKTVIFSTHVMSEAEKLCDTIGIIHDGKLLTEGTLAELRARHSMHDLEDIFVKLVEAGA